MTIRPRRSVLFMPGSNARALDKARSLDADAIIMDLEDAVAPAAKAEARGQVAAAVRAGGYGSREVVVRINGDDTEWAADDLEAVAELGVDAILLPKVESAELVARIAARVGLTHAGATPALWAMIETPIGVLRAEAIANASPRLQCLVMGTSDLAKELRVPPSPDRAGLLHALGHCVLAARAAELDILDGVHLDLADGDGLERACRQARELGFDGKTLIHPGQIAAANAAFAPSVEAARAAVGIIDAWQAAAAQGRGVVVVDGRLVENLHVAEARRTIALARACRMLGDELAPAADPDQPLPTEHR